MKKWMGILLAVLLLTVTCTACAGASMDVVKSEETAAVTMQEVTGGGYVENGYDAMADSMVEVEEEIEMEYAEEAAGMDVTATDLPQDGRKIIRNTSLTIESKAFTDSVAQIKQAVSDANGYIEFSSLYTGGRTQSAEYICRIPAERYADFMSGVQSAGSVVHTEESTEDATAQYVDMEARLNSLHTQEKRLLELMEESGSLEELLAVQEKLMDVQYQIESYTGQMKALTDRIDYATVSVWLEEVETYTPVQPTFLQRIDNAFSDMLLNVQDGAEDLVLGIIYLIPLWIIGGVGVILGVVLVKRRRRRRAQKLQAQYEAMQAENQEKQ